VYAGPLSSLPYLANQSVGFYTSTYRDFISSDKFDVYSRARPPIFFHEEMKHEIAKPEIIDNNWLIDKQMLKMRSIELQRLTSSISDVNIVE